jgi:hypothetical protein
MYPSRERAKEQTALNKASFSHIRAKISEIAPSNGVL